MKVDIRKMNGPWDLGYSLDKHTLSSTYIGDDDRGRPKFDTKRTEVGEALYQLKYKSAHALAGALANEIVSSLGSYFKGASVVVPIPPSKRRSRQPTAEIAKEVGNLTGIQYREDLLVKRIKTPQMKDIASREERLALLRSAFATQDVLVSRADVLLIDDLFDTGSSLEAATLVLRDYAKIRKVFVVTVTRSGHD
jgi:predicted amidophosphoribosyltransferase